MDEAGRKRGRRACGAIARWGEARRVTRGWARRGGDGVGSETKSVRAVRMGRDEGRQRWGGNGGRGRAVG